MNLKEQKRKSRLRVLDSKVKKVKDAKNNNIVKNLLNLLNETGEKVGDSVNIGELYDLAEQVAAEFNANKGLVAIALEDWPYGELPQNVRIEKGKIFATTPEGKEISAVLDTDDPVTVWK